MQHSYHGHRQGVATGAIWNGAQLDVLFFIKSLKSPTASFNINSRVTFFSGITLLAKTHKLKNSASSNNSLHTSIEFPASGMPYLFLIVISK